MPVGGKLLLKGGQPLKPKRKKKIRKKIPKELVDEVLAGEEAAKLEDTKATEPSINPSAVAVQSGKAYEQEFSLEMKKAQEGKPRSTPWGSSFRAPPKVLHGYDREVKGDNAEERLDLRCAMKGDKFCK